MSLDSLYVCVCFTCLYTCAPCVCLCPWSSEKGIWSHGTEVKGGRKPACVCKELNPGPLKEPQVLVTNEPSLLPHAINFLIHTTSAPVGHLKFAPQISISILLFPHLCRVEREASHRDSHTALISTQGVLSINKELEIHTATKTAWTSCVGGK